MDEEFWCFEKDDDCHDYLIPFSLSYKFYQLLEQDEDEFIELFKRYRINSYRDYKFLNPIKDY
jgi:hypothetical protein